jgi:hypothetical protein
MTTATATAWLSISEVAAQAGTSTATLRVWEQRYGWPAPRRSPSGNRRFTPGDLDQIRQVVARVDAGTPIRELIIDGRPHLLPPIAKPTHAQLDLSAVPSPTTADGLAAQRLLILGLAQRHPGRIREAVARCALLRPSDRGPAVLQVLAACRAQHTDHAWLDQILTPCPGTCQPTIEHHAALRESAARCWACGATTARIPWHADFPPPDINTRCLDAFRAKYPHAD